MSDGEYVATIWVDTNLNNTGTDLTVDGVPLNPVSTYEAALVLKKKYKKANGKEINIKEMENE